MSVASAHPDAASSLHIHRPAAALAVQKGERLVSIDAFRGLLMLCIAVAGPNRGWSKPIFDTHSSSWFWEQVHRHTNHAGWFGATLWDMLQPSFMFLVGVSMVYSYDKRKRLGHSFSQMLGHACYRAVLLTALGVFLRSNGNDMTRWTFNDVLSQIGLAYVFVFLLRDRSWKMQLAAIVAILMGYWALFAFSPFVDPQHTQWLDHWRKHANVGTRFDVWFLNLFPRQTPFVFNKHASVTLNFIPSMAVMIAGVMASNLMRRTEVATRRKTHLLIVSGLIAMTLALLLHFSQICPIVKRTWTPSFSLLSGGVCLATLACLHGIIDGYQWRRWTFPFVVLGANALVVYFLMRITSPWFVATLSTHLGAQTFDAFGPPFANLLQNLSSAMTIWLVVWWLYRRKIFVRI